ncbi:ras, putative [Entamoeba dispar SAW760]|uniref:Ras, putative n=1 Tax=Entamoeba dispar (strain ATCC PRA-260 / SAW760) TaxID=370354 RepID=B0EAD0_ENTDS|nr:ras, putative [Entamoeba dispar SAW760]EDR28515.1 ras, putative [Entamoeba dispar SAW760]|eukprot:EDR28515.1 ras, putative [Entamoeba dispar SAW760]
MVMKRTILVLRNQYIKQGDGFVLIYSITSKESFEVLQQIYEDIYQVRKKEYNEHIPIIIVCNKNDLEDDRQVTKEEGINYADSTNCPFIECNTKTREDINRIFEVLTIDVLEHKDL